MREIREMLREYDLKSRLSGNYTPTLERDAHKCTECSSTRNIVVHHIDGNRKNNVLLNLKTLCRPCHADAHGYSSSKDRRRLISEMREEGLSFRKIGKRLGISGQRAHQLVKRKALDIT